MTAFERGHRKPLPAGAALGCYFVYNAISLDLDDPGLNT
jgi:hypothetical protein